MPMPMLLPVDAVYSFSAAVIPALGKVLLIYCGYNVISLSRSLMQSLIAY